MYNPIQVINMGREIKMTVGDLIDALNVFDQDTEIQIRMHPDDPYQNNFYMCENYIPACPRPKYKEFDVKFKEQIF